MLEEAKAVTVLIESKITSKIKILAIVAGLRGENYKTDYEISQMADLANKIYEKFTKE